MTAEPSLVPPGRLPGGEDFPVIVRLAGLPASALEPLSSPLCVQYLEAWRYLEAQLRKACSEMVDLLYRELPRHPPRLRRFLLGVKRSCFNGKGLGKYKVTPQWPDLRVISGVLADQIVELEAETAQAGENYENAYRQELARERRHLIKVLEDARFARAIALASPDLISQARTLGRDRRESAVSKERKIERSLLRYVTRAAAKLSPYSTLTVIGLGTARNQVSPGLRFASGRCREVSLFRLNRSLLDQCWEILMRHPALRDVCYIALNVTAEELEPGRYRFLRPGHWELSEEAGELRFSPASQVKVNLEGPLISLLQRELAGEPVLCHELIARLCRDDHVRGLSGANAERRVRKILDDLVSLGFLSLLPPWPTRVPHLELEMLCFLRGLPQEPALKTLVDTLDRLVSKEAVYCREPHPEIAIQEIQRLADEFLEAARALCTDNMSSNSSTFFKKNNPHFFYEDVFLMPVERPEEVIEIPLEAVREIMASARALGKFAYLFSHHHDILHSLAAFWSDRWPQRRELGLLELFDAIRPWWREYLKFDRLHRRVVFSSFNVMSLDTICDLDVLRRRIFCGAQNLMEECPSGYRLPLHRFTALLDEIPDRYDPMIGPCVFVQPMDSRGDAWVLNRLFEGTGRYSSRYTMVMEEPLRSQYLARATDGSAVRVNGEEVELLDLMFTRGTTSNLHMPQTKKILQMPGEYVGVPPDRRVSLRDIKIQADLVTETFCVLDQSGQRYLPVHLSNLANPYMPVLLRFLSVFGPYELRQILPRPMSRAKGEDLYSDRVLCGKLVVRRRRWEIGTTELRTKITAVSDPEAFRHVRSWHLEKGLPSQVFVYEPIVWTTNNGIEALKPQFVDFSSPSHVENLCSILKTGIEQLIIEETLPAFQEFPRDERGEQWGCEIQIDSILSPKEDDSYLAHHRCRSAGTVSTLTPAEVNR